MAKYIKSKKYQGVQHYIKANGTKSYYIRFKDENNKLIRVKVGDENDGTDEVYCKNKRIEILNAINKGEQPPKFLKNHRKKIITLDVVADKYFSSKANTDSTHERLSKYNKHLSPSIGMKSIIHITKSDLEKIQQDIIIKKKLSERTANLIIELFSTIFTYGFKDELYNTSNPAKKIIKYKVKNTRERFLRKKEIKKLYKYVIAKDAENGYGNMLELFTKLALTTGGRLQGILHIKKCDINLQSDIIRITDFKNGGEVYSGYIGKTTRKLLNNKLKLLNSNDYVVSFNDSGIQVTNRQLQTRLKSILDDLFNVGLEKNDRKNRVVIHTLRHTFASQLALANTPIRQIQELMNHANITETMKYAKLQDDMNKKAAQNIF